MKSVKWTSLFNKYIYTIFDLQTNGQFLKLNMARTISFVVKIYNW